MDFYALSDKAIANELGNRFKSLRLRRNITQQSLSEATTLSLNAIKALEKGRAKLSTVIAVLRELQALDQLNNFIPQPTVSPLELAKRQGRTRQRATGERDSSTDSSDESW